LQAKSVKSKFIIKQEFVFLNNIKIQYFVYGNGPSHLVTLHGFGRDYRDFFFFEELTKTYKVIGINLCYHGESTFPIDRISKRPITKLEWYNLFELILEKEKVDNFSLLSYSMGGKFAFCLLEKFSKKINKSVFLAPDGVIVNPWYKLVTHTKIGENLSKLFTKNTLGLPQLIALSSYLGLTSENLKKFVEFNVSSKEKRQKIYLVWQSFKLINPNHELINKNLKKKSQNTLVILGKRDVAIKAAYSKFLNEQYGDLVLVKILDLGHNLFKPETKLKVSEFLA